MRRVLLAALLALGACVFPPPSRWTPTGPAFVAPKAGFELVPPPGWMRLTSDDPEVLVITCDGTPLQRIAVMATEVGKPFEMTPEELAELVVDGLRATEALTEFRILENAPATVAGKDGFRMLVAFRGANGLRSRAAFYGVLQGGLLYELVYAAPERHYFALDLPTFETLVRTFRLRPPAPSPTAPRSTHEPQR